MNKLFGILSALIAVLLFVWLDIFVLFVGGISQIINGFNADPNDVHDIVWGFVKVLLLDGMGLTAAAAIFFFISLPLLFGRD